MIVVKKTLIALSLVLVVLNIVVGVIWYTAVHRDDPYTGRVDMPPVFTSEGLDRGAATPAAEIAVDAYQRGWYHLVKGEQITDISDLGPIRDGASITDFPVIQKVNSVIVQSDNFVGPKRVVDAVYVTKNKAGDFVATACEYQNPEDIRVVSDTGVADTLEGLSGWRVTIGSDKDGDYMKEIAGNAETCKKVRGLLK